MNRIQKIRYDTVRWIWFVPDRMTDKQMEKTPEWVFEAWDWSTGYIKKFLCILAGHEPTCDACGNADHDFCLWCGKMMPGEAHINY